VVNGRTCVFNEFYGLVQLSRDPICLKIKDSGLHFLCCCFTANPDDHPHPDSQPLTLLSCTWIKWIEVDRWIYHTQTIAHVGMKQTSSPSALVSYKWTKFFRVNKSLFACSKFYNRSRRFGETKSIHIRRERGVVSHSRNGSQFRDVQELCKSLKPTPNSHQNT